MSNLLNIKKEVGQRLKESRKAIGKTQTEIAKMLNMTQQQYSRFENGVFELSYDQIITLCQIYDISSDFLFGMKSY